MYLAVHFKFWLLLLGLGWLYSPPLSARELEVPVRFEQAFLRHLLAEQVYTDASNEARVWDDGKDCNFLTLSNPEVGFKEGRVRTKTAARARIGTVLGKYCLSIVNWNGFMEIDQQPFLTGTVDVVEFRVTDSRIYAGENESKGVFGALWDWSKKYVHPRFNRLHLELFSITNELREILPMVFPQDPGRTGRLVDSVQVGRAEIIGDRIELGIHFAIPEGVTPVRTPPVDEPEPELTPEELNLWNQSWQQWDAFLTAVIKRAGTDAEVRSLRAALLAVLLDARLDILEVLAGGPARGPDPVPELFTLTWERLSPELRSLSGALPLSPALRYFGFIAAADALSAIQAVGQQTGFVLSANALRRLARIIAATEGFDPLYYGTAVDAELRTLFGFGEPLPLPALNQPLTRIKGTTLHYGGGPGPALMYLPVLMVRENHYDQLAAQLNGWVPTIKRLNEYLPLVQQLLDQIVRETLRVKQLDAQYRELYRPLVLATAWQESCWRQFVKVKGKITPIRSNAGAVGIMQINQHVWRGFYDVESLKHDVGYNALAGSEILHHYLVDYAVAKGEYKQAGGYDNLARATYAMYNGGPRQMARYRNANTAKSLRAIDEAYWKKFETIRSGNVMAVAECYGG